MSSTGEKASNENKKLASHTKRQSSDLTHLFRLQLQRYARGTNLGGLFSSFSDENAQTIGIRPRKCSFLSNLVELHRYTVSLEEKSCRCSGDELRAGGSSNEVILLPAAKGIGCQRLVYL